MLVDTIDTKECVAAYIFSDQKWFFDLKMSLMPKSMPHFPLSVDLSLPLSLLPEAESGGHILALSTLNCQHSTWLCASFADGSF